MATFYWFSYNASSFQLLHLDDLPCDFDTSLLLAQLTRNDPQFIFILNSYENIPMRECPPVVLLSVRYEHRCGVSLTSDTARRKT